MEKVLESLFYIGHTLKFLSFNITCVCLSKCADPGEAPALDAFILYLSKQCRPD